MAEALRVELPAGGDQAADLVCAEAALRRRQAGQLDVLVADPAEPPQHGERLGELRLVAVVEAEHDRFACAAARSPCAPVGRDLVERDGVPARALQRLHLFGELRRGHVEAREGRAGGGGAITWYIRIGTGACPGRPAGAARPRSSRCAAVHPRRGCSRGRARRRRSRACPSRRRRERDGEHDHRDRERRPAERAATRRRRTARRRARGAHASDSRSMWPGRGRSSRNPCMAAQDSRCNG